ncbi:MAG: putative glycolipid-binding domain-containing protein [Chloroflexota bacterium]
MPAATVLPTPALIDATVLWRRIDSPGHDACRLQSSEAGWSLDGTAIFSQSGIPAQLAYQVECDREWHTRWGHVHGWIGARSVTLDIVRTSRGDWAFNGAVITKLGHCVDLDLGFSPSTNLIAIRRLALGIGQAAEASAAWLDVLAESLVPLPQRYARRAVTTYWYEAPTVEYAAVLEVNSIGFIQHYPGLWEIQDSDC